MSERLRAFVRARVHKEGAFYERGAAVKLAIHVQQAPSWVSHYIDNPPLRNADVDTALAICDFFGVSLNDFRPGRAPAPAVMPKKVAPAITRAVKMLELMDEPRRQRAVLLLGDLFLASERARRQGSPRQSGGTSAATSHKARGTR